MEVYCPQASGVREEIVRTEIKYRVQIGKKLIKFYNDSGIWDTTCAKIYSEKCLQLPGEFFLPVTLIKETFYFYDTDSVDACDEGENSWLSAFVQKYLKSVMIAGEIVNAQESCSSTEDADYLSGKYICLEMIGQVKFENTISKDKSYD